MSVLEEDPITWVHMFVRDWPSLQFLRQYGDPACTDSESMTMFGRYKPMISAFEREHSFTRARIVHILGWISIYVQDFLDSMLIPLARTGGGDEAPLFVFFALPQRVMRSMDGRSVFIKDGGWEQGLDEMWKCDGYFVCAMVATGTGFWRRFGQNGFDKSLANYVRYYDRALVGRGASQNVLRFVENELKDVALPEQLPVI